MNLYVVRHGQTDWNIQGKIQGSTDIELNQIGINQASQTAELLKDIDFNAIYSSPLKRTFSTAELINKYHNVNIITDTRLVERGFGDFEGSKNVLYNIEEYLDYEKNLNTNNVECIQDVFGRIESFLSYIYDTYKNSNSNVLIVTHGGISIAITAIINNIKKDLASITMENCEVKVFNNFIFNK